MDLIITSDTHELHREVNVPMADVFIHCGDFTMFDRSVAAIEDFNDWLGDLPHSHKIVIYGNHQFAFEADPSRRALLDNAVVLLNESIEIEGLKIYGSPMTPLFGGAFGMSKAVDRQRHWARVPDDTHVLISHGPPLGLCDTSADAPEHVGDPELLARIGELTNLRLVCCGHVHSAYGRTEYGGVLVVNAALMGRDGDLANSPIVLRMRHERSGS